MRVMILGATLAALAACSTDKRLLTPDHEADKIISPETRHREGRGADPVCGASLDHADETWSSRTEDGVYYFDSAECKKQFDRNPDLYRASVR